MKAWKSYFKGKKVTVMGIDLEGRGIQDTTFLSQCGADIIATDLKTSDQLEASLLKLKEYKNIEYVLGKHRLEDFQNRDLIVRAASVPLGSPYIQEAKKQGIEIETDETLFVKLAPKLTIVAVTGTRGKSTTTQLIFEILKEFLHNSKQQAFLGGNVRGRAMLPLLVAAKAGDIVVMELSSWHLQGFAEHRMHPNIAVFTTFFADHLNYYKKSATGVVMNLEQAMDTYLDDKANIFKFQTKRDILILGSQAAPIVQQKYGETIKSKIIIPNSATAIPSDWKIQIPGEHNRYDIALAVEAAKVLGVDEKTIKKAVENFKGVSGRLEFLKEINDVKIYNDTTATTSDATVAALEALSGGARGKSKSNIILIAGGTDKGLDMTKLIEAIPRHCKKVILLPGTGTDRLTIQNQQAPIEVSKVPTLKEAVAKALAAAAPGDTILFSPAFASFGMFKNEFDRGEQFVALINSLIKSL